VVQLSSGIGSQMSGKLEVRYSVSASFEDLSQAAAQHLLEQVESAAEARGIARIAISGGNTPKRMFELLADQAGPLFKRMPWDRLQIYWVDERCVPPDHPDSNYRMTREALLDKAPLRPEQIFRMEGELEPELAAARYESLIRGQFRLEGAQIPTFDVVSLGMGDDGHTASLFPHTQAIYELGRVVVANSVPQKNTWRLTLTAPVLNQGRDVFFLVQGKDKAKILKEVLLGTRDPDMLPSQLIRPASGTLLFLLDAAAAQELPPPDSTGMGRLEIER
jgi:6-phosphogluconolactonase